MVLAPFLQFIYPRLLRLCRSPLPLGQALPPLLSLLQQLVRVLCRQGSGGPRPGPGPVSYADILSSLYSNHGAAAAGAAGAKADQVRVSLHVAPVAVYFLTEVRSLLLQAPLSKHALVQLSQCVAAVCLCEAVPAAQRQQAVLHFVADIEQRDDQVRQLALLCLGKSEVNLVDKKLRIMLFEDSVQ